MSCALAGSVLLELSLLYNTGWSASPGGRMRSAAGRSPVWSRRASSSPTTAGSGPWPRRLRAPARYPLVDGSARVEIKGRIFRTLFDGEIPEPRDVAIIGLVHYCDGFRAMLEPDEYEEARELIEIYSGIDMIARAIATVVRTSYRPPKSRSRTPPKVNSASVFAGRSRKFAVSPAKNFKFRVTGHRHPLRPASR